MTENQLKSEIYAVVNPIIDLFWLSRPTRNQSFPLATYSIIDQQGVYSFGITRSAESRAFQIDLYLEPDDLVANDALFDQLKTAMEGIDYMLLAAPEFLDSDINKIIKTTRWERYNV